MTQKDRYCLLFIGGSGLVGSRVKDLLNNSFSILAPPRSAMNITNEDNVSAMIQKIKPTVIINFAVIIQIDNSEKQRGDTQGDVWNVNVNGVKHIVHAIKNTKIRLIQISTDAVFPGTADDPGPYAEHDKSPDSGKNINWYGLTKRIAEKEVEKLGDRGTVIRISYPFGNPHSSADLVQKTIFDIEHNQSIFVDQLFTPTYIPDVATAIQSIVEQRASGIFHVGCFPRIRRYTFARYIAKLLTITSPVRKGSMQEYVRKRGVPRTRLGGLATTKTRHTLGISFHSWKDAVNEYLMLTKFSK